MPTFWAVVLCGALLLQAGAGFIPLFGEEGRFLSDFDRLRVRPWKFVRVWYWPVPLLTVSLWLWTRARREPSRRDGLAGLGLTAVGLVGLVWAGPSVATPVSAASVLAIATSACAVLWESRERTPGGD